jgi:uncharacterized protein (TIGR02147 family)
MDSIYRFTDYRAVIRKRFEEFPKKGYGQARRLAQHLKCHTTMISQVMSGIKTLTMEQALLTAEFLGFNEQESDYFILLVQLDRAGSEALRENLRSKIERMRAHSEELVNRLVKKRDLTEDQKAIFYSDWSYAAVRQVTALGERQPASEIAARLNLPIKHVVKVLEFLIETGLCVKTAHGIKIGPSATHLESSSPWVRTHHTNWRQKAIASLNDDQKSKLHYTAPMTLSAADALRIRDKLVGLLEEVDKILDPSPVEELHCLNIDWFKLT